MKKILSLLVLLCVVGGPFESFAALSLKAFRQRPKLVVVVVIDQFRADYLTRFESRFLPAEAQSKLGGFNYLMAKSAYFPFAQYDILQSMTCPGHATIMTGSHPYLNGISLNEWYDRGEKRTMYCVEDKDFGVSPRKLIANTVSDEMKMAGRKGKVISVALKDRSAIMLGGHRADAAFWFAPDFRWVSSKYYFANGKVPEWVEKINVELASQKGQSYTFKSEGKGSGMSELAQEFSHETKIGSHESLTFPFGIKITTEMAIRALREYKLGESRDTDFLTISYSSHDSLGHETSLNNREMEEMTVAEDLQISNLINSIRSQIKANFSDVVFVLTGDHGVAPSVDYLKESKIEAEYFNPKKMLEELNQKMSVKFGKIEESWVLAVRSLNFYLNLKAAATKKLSANEIEEFVKTELLKTPGIAFAFSKSDFMAKNLPSGQHERQIRKTYNPLVNGDVVLIPKPFFVDTGHTSTHMTGYNYDRTVPLLILARNLKSGVYPASTEVIDLAPTLAFLLGVLPPSLSEGRVLSEAFVDSSSPCQARCAH